MPASPGATPGPTEDGSTSEGWGASLRFYGEQRSQAFKRRFGPLAHAIQRTMDTSQNATLGLRIRNQRHIAHRVPAGTHRGDGDQTRSRASQTMEDISHASW